MKLQKPLLFCLSLGLLAIAGPAAAERRLATASDGSNYTAPDFPPEFVEKLRQNQPMPAPSAGRAEVVMLADGFEGNFPGPWGLAYGISAGVDNIWGKTTFTKKSGTSSAYCAAQGTVPVNPATGTHPPLMDAWIAAGPFNLSDAQSAFFDFSLYYETEACCDGVRAVVSVDPTFPNNPAITRDTAFSGFSDGWEDWRIDFSNFGLNYLGQPAVYVAFRFTSDESVEEKGAFVDDVVVFKNTAGPSPTPTATPTASPSPTPVGTPTPSATPSPTPSPSATPSATPTPPPGVEEKTFTVFNQGNAILRVTGISKQNNSSWLTVIPPISYPVEIPAGQSRVFRVQVNKNGLANGTHVDRLLVASNDADENPYPNGVNVTVVAGPLPEHRQIAKFILDEGGSNIDANSDGLIDSADVVRRLP